MVVERAGLELILRLEHLFVESAFRLLMVG
jgi:hypothetical protein